jgi:Na+-driven multidrug efflux pump
MVPLGCSFAASAFTGYFCACGKTVEAKKYSRLTLLFGVILNCVQLTLLYLFQNEIAQAFTTDPAVYEIVDQALTVLYIYIFFDTIHGINSGTIRGLGRQFQASIITFSCYWVLGLGYAIYLGFKQNQGVPGMWHSFAYACVLYVVLQLVVIEYKPWPDFRKDAHAELAAPRTPEDRAFRRVVKANEIKKGNTPIIEKRNLMISVN